MGTLLVKAARRAMQPRAGGFQLETARRQPIALPKKATGRPCLLAAWFERQARKLAAERSQQVTLVLRCYDFLRDESLSAFAPDGSPQRLATWMVRKANRAEQRLVIAETDGAGEWRWSARHMDGAPFGEDVFLAAVQERICGAAIRGSTGPTTGRLKPTASAGGR